MQYTKKVKDLNLGLFHNKLFQHNYLLIHIQATTRHGASRKRRRKGK